MGAQGKSVTDAGGAVVESLGSTGNLDAWITGLRRDQWATRTNIRKVEIDHDHGGIVKLAPLADWTEDEVWDYIRTNDVPYNELYDKGYKSIGCAPCTRPVAEGQDPRAGRWWWETGAPKECGMHCALETGGFEHELAALLGASPAAISGAVRYLGQVGMISREREPGSRRDVYLVLDDIWYEVSVRQDQVLARWVSAARDGVEVLGPRTPAGKRVADSLDFFLFLEQEMPALLERWRAHRAARGT